MEMSVENGRPVEPSAEIYKRIMAKTAQMLNGASASQEAESVIADMLELHKRRDTLKPQVSMALQKKIQDPNLQALSQALIERVSREGAGEHPDPEVIQQGIELARLLEVGKNNEALAGELEGLTARYQPKPQAAEPEVKEAPFVPLVEEADIPEEDEDTQHAVLLVLGEVMIGLPKTPQNHALFKKVDAGDADALSRLVQMAVREGEADRIMQKCRTLLDKDSQRGAEVAPILAALSKEQGVDPKVWRILGDANRLAGKYAESAAAYREYLKIPPKT